MYILFCHPGEGRGLVKKILPDAGPSPAWRFIFLFLLFLSPSQAFAASAKAYFAMGCFWCGESDMEKVTGVLSVTSGYSGGTVDNPGYEQVSNGRTGHYEVIEVVYDPARVSYDRLLEVFWRNVDPLDPTGQFCDKGDQYKAAVFYSNETEKAAAEASLKKTAVELGQDVATEIVPFKKFWAAEDYHQDYYKKNPIRYKFYRGSCGRDERLKEVWGKKAGGHSN